MNELTDVCETNEGFIYPGTTPDNCDTTYHDEIVAILTADGIPSLEGLNTTSRAVDCTLIRIVIDVGGSDEAQTWVLRQGTASEDGQIQPTDYDPTNTKFWEKVGG